MSLSPACLTQVQRLSKTDYLAAAAAKTSPKSKAKAASQAAYEQRRKALDEWQDLDAFGDSDASSASDEGSEYGGESDMGNGGRAVSAETRVDVAQPIVGHGCCGGDDDSCSCRFFFGPQEVRGLPTCDSVYDSLVKIYKVYVAALVPVYGISVMVLTPTHGSVPIKCNRNKPRYVNLPGGACPWVAFCRRRHDGKWIVDFDVSTFEHSHGPCKEILADPTWRPTVHNADARAVLGMPPLHKQSTHKRQTFSEPVSDSVTVCWCALGKNLTCRKLIEAGPAPAQEGALVGNPKQRKHDASAARADSPAHVDSCSSASAILARSTPLESVCSAFVPFAGVPTSPSDSCVLWRRGVWVQPVRFRYRGEQQFRAS